jgi:hypothetical protein
MDSKKRIIVGKCREMDACTLAHEMDHLEEVTCEFTHTTYRPWRDPGVDDKLEECKARKLEAKCLATALDKPDISNECRELMVLRRHDIFQQDLLNECHKYNLE